MFLAVRIFVFDDIDVVPAILHAALILSIPAIVDVFAGKNMLAVRHIYIQLIIVDFRSGYRFENVVQSITVWSECVGDGKERLDGLIVGRSGGWSRI